MQLRCYPPEWVPSRWCLGKRVESAGSYPSSEWDCFLRKLQKNSKPQGESVLGCSLNILVRLPRLSISGSVAGETWGWLGWFSSLSGPRPGGYGTGARPWDLEWFWFVCWHHFSMVLSSYRYMLGIFAILLVAFSHHVGIMLESLWHHFGITLHSICHNVHI